MTSALIFDGHLSSALAAARSLHERGVRVVVGATRRTALTLYSRAAADVFVYPDPKTDRTAYLEVIRTIAQTEYDRTGQRPVPYFFSDDTFLPVARASKEIRANLAWSYPSLQVIEKVFDKQSTLRVAEQEGLPVPIAYTRSEALALSQEYFPLILKPRHSCVWPETGHAVRGTAERVHSVEELSARFSAITERMREEPLIQGCITGEEVGVFTVCLDGQPQGWFSHRRLLGIHPDGGASSVRLSTDSPPVLVEQSSKLLQAVGWTGPAMVEWKYDQSTTIYRLMEINGRWWGSLALTLAANDPVVWDWYRYSTEGIRSTSLPAPHLNVQAVHLLAVGKCVLNCLRQGRFRQALKGIRLCFPMHGRTLVFDVESVRDPAPFVWELIDVVARIVLTK